MAEITFTHGVFNEKQVSCIHSFCLIEKEKQVTIANKQLNHLRAETTYTGSPTTITFRFLLDKSLA